VGHGGTQPDCSCVRRPLVLYNTSLLHDPNAGGPRGMR
jgi:hypothetical protein